jgi:hypothetical protein
MLQAISLLSSNGGRLVYFTTPTHTHTHTHTHKHTHTHIQRERERELERERERERERRYIHTHTYRLVYSTCSIAPEENDAVVEKLLRTMTSTKEGVGGLGGLGGGLPHRGT